MQETRATHRGTQALPAMASPGRRKLHLARPLQRLDTHPATGRKAPRRELRRPRPLFNDEDRRGKWPVICFIFHIGVFHSILWPSTFSLCMWLVSHSLFSHTRPRLQCELISRRAREQCVPKGHLFCVSCMAILTMPRSAESWMRSDPPVLSRCL